MLATADMLVLALRVLPREIHKWLNARDNLPEMNGLPVHLEVRVLPPLSLQPPLVAFTYEITPSGDITVTETDSGIKHYGRISKDMNTMTLLSANNVQIFGGNFLNTICNFARTLIKVNGEHD